MTKKNTAKQKQPPSVAAQTVKKLDFIFSQGPGKGLGNEGFLQLQSPAGIYFPKEKAGASRLLADETSALYFCLLVKND